MSKVIGSQILWLTLLRGQPNCGSRRGRTITKGVTHEKAAVKSLGALDKKIELFQAVFTKSEHI